MPHTLRGAEGRLDLASSLMICSYCLGDLVAMPDADGNSFICIQCHQRTAGRSRPLAAPAAGVTNLLIDPPPPPTDKLVA